MLNGTLNLSRTKELLEYDAVNGVFTRKSVNHPKDKIGEIAGTKARSRIVVGVDGIQYDAGKLAVFMYTGSVPYKVFYKDSDRFNIRFANLMYVLKKPCSKSSEPVPINILKGLFTVDYESGTLIRRVSTYRAQKEAVAGYKANNGYLAVSVVGVRALVHRVIWAIHYDAWPEGDIDHIDNDKTNNRIPNLRMATKSQNSMNTRIRKDSTTGIKGVCYNSANSNYRVRLIKDNTPVEVGSFLTIQAAAEAVKLARKKIHGDFCNHG